MNESELSETPSPKHFLDKALDAIDGRGIIFMFK